MLATIRRHDHPQNPSLNQIRNLKLSQPRGKERKKVRFDDVFIARRFNVGAIKAQSSVADAVVDNDENEKQTMLGLCIALYQRCVDWGIFLRGICLFILFNLYGLAD